MGAGSLCTGWFWAGPVCAEWFTAGPFRAGRHEGAADGVVVRRTGMVTRRSSGAESMTERERHLPMAWLFVRVSSAESYTFRWGRGSGVMTVHTGDQRTRHTDDQLVAAVRLPEDWRNDEDVRAQARKWLRGNVARGAPR